MNNPLTEYLNEVELRARGAYGMPWVYSEQYNFRYVLSKDNEILLSGKKDRDEQNLRFCAHASTDIPTLVRLVREMATALEKHSYCPACEPCPGDALRRCDEILKENGK